MTDHQTDTQRAAYLAGTLDELAVERLERHAAACAVCGHALEAATRIPGVAELPRDIPPPDAVRSAVRRAIAARPPRRRRRWMLSAVAAGVTVVVVATLSRPAEKAALGRPPLGPPIVTMERVPLGAATSVRLHVGLGTVTVRGDGTTDAVSLAGTRDDRTQVRVVRRGDVLELAVVPEGEGQWPAEGMLTLSVPAGVAVTVSGRDLVVRNLGGTGPIRLEGKVELRTVGAGGITPEPAPVPRTPESSP